MRLCPTRTDERAALFAHKVSLAQCQSRQRGQYHKCFTCAYNNAYVAKFGMPEARAAEEFELAVTNEFAALPQLPELPDEVETAEAPGATPAKARHEAEVETSIGPAQAC